MKISIFRHRAYCLYIILTLIIGLFLFSFKKPKDDEIEVSKQLIIGYTCFYFKLFLKAKKGKYVLYECVNKCGGWADRTKGIF